VDCVPGAVHPDDWKAIDWADTFFVVTSQRIMLASGVLTKKVAMLPRDTAKS
jgi:hypothetical protein